MAQMMRCFPTCHTGVRKLVESFDTAFCGNSRSSSDASTKTLELQFGQVDHGDQMQFDDEGPRVSLKAESGYFIHDFRRQTSRQAVEEPKEQMDPSTAAQQELDMLEAQARKLRATVARRRRCEGASCRGDNVSSIVAHYESVLSDLERQMAKLSHMIEGYSAAL